MDGFALCSLIIDRIEESTRQFEEKFDNVCFRRVLPRFRRSFNSFEELNVESAKVKNDDFLLVSARTNVYFGVDWKSLTIPACLPITTDYFPDDVCLRTDYVFSDYNLLPDAVNADYARQRVIYRKPLKTHEVFQELISQRLAQGFQLILDDSNGPQISISGQTGSVVAGSRNKEGSQIIEYKLSIGRIFHRITLTGSEIRVTRYRPRHPYPPFNFHYWYRLQAPDHPTYGVSSISFSTEKLENFNWNYFDHYVCTRGDADFALLDALKYWRFRVFILPTCQVATRKILEGSTHCDIYNCLSIDEQQTVTENFLKYIETWINKIKRLQTQKKQRIWRFVPVLSIFISPTKRKAKLEVGDV